MAEEGQKAWQAWVDVGRLHVSTPWPLVDAEIKAAWAAVERTIANDALRRAAQVTRAVQTSYRGRSDVDRGGWMAAEDIADGINALIKEPTNDPR